MQRFLAILFSAILLACGSGNDDQTSQAPCESMLLPGDLVITELMVDPSGADGGLEWIEIYNASGATQCLNGVRVSMQTATSSDDYFIVSSEAIQLEAGAYAAMGAGTQEWLFHTISPDFSMTNTAGTIYLRLGADTIDSVAYGDAQGSVGEPRDGKSLALCGECLAANCNDTAEVWFATSDELYDGENSGTPGAPNADCLCNTPEGTAAPVAGDLLITELFPNPNGSDGDKEWFEIYVEADHPVDLAGVEVFKDPEGEPELVLGEDQCLVGLAGDYLLLARSADTSVNGGIEPGYVYGGALTLNNSNSMLELRYQATVLDSVEYSSTEEGASLQWDAQTEEWCTGKTPFGEGEDQGFGTPGEANAGCSAPTGCLLNGEMVDLVAPQQGDLEITEIFPNTPGNEDAHREWFEIRNTTAGAIDVNGVELWKDPDDDTPETTLATEDGTCIRIPTGGTVLFARSDDPTVNGLPEGGVFYVYGSHTFNNSGYFGLHLGPVVIDAVSYDDSEDGKALQKDPESGAFCDASSVYWEVDGKQAFGTPGSANQQCGVVYCVDGDNQRPVSHPPVGSLVVTEVFANPDGSDTSAREWVEVYVTAEGAGYDLNGLQIRVNGSESGILAEGEELCVVADTGYWVFAGSDIAEENGDLPRVDVVAGGLGLKNSDVELTITSGTTVIDFMEYASTSQGVAWQLEGGMLDATSNDDTGNWCESPAPFNEDMELGTPGDANPSCDAVYCTDPIDNSLVEVTPIPAGALILTEVYPNTPGADDTAREWFEVYVPPEVASFAINGLAIITQEDGDADYVFDVDQCIELAPGNHYVFCRNASPDLNGGIGGCIEYSSISLKNTDGYLGLVSGMLHDEAPYGTAGDGISRSLDPNSYNVQENDEPANWCDTPEGNTFDDGSVRGTPGMMNPSCN